MKDNQAKTENTEIRFLTKGNCKSVSGKAELSYEIGCDKGKSLHFRIVASNGGAIFSRQWRELSPIESLLISGKPINAKLIQLPKQSSNNSSFNLAILVHLGLIKMVSENPRKYERNDPAGFHQQMLALIDSAPPPADQKTATKVKEKKKEAPIPDSQEKEA